MYPKNKVFRLFGSSRSPEQMTYFKKLIPRQPSLPITYYEGTTYKGCKIELLPFSETFAANRNCAFFIFTKRLFYRFSILYH